MSTKIKPLALNIGLTVGALAIGLLIGEIGLRIAKIEYPPPPREGENTDKQLYNFKEPNRGWGGNPNRVSYWNGEGEPGEIKMNNAGFRDKDWNVEKPANTYRVAVLGDSFTEAIQVKTETRYTSVMERELAKCSALKGKKIEVLNFGVQGYGTAQELMTLRHNASAYSPDLVVLAFYPGNDIQNNYRPLEHDHLRPYFVYDQNGKLVEDLSFRNIAFEDRDKYSYSWVDKLPYNLVQTSRILQILRKTDLDNKKRQLEKDYRDINVGFYKDASGSKEWQEAWKVTEGLIKLMHDEVVAKNADFVVMNVSDSYQVVPNPQWAKDFMGQYSIPNDLLYPERRIKEFAEREKIALFSTIRPLKVTAEKINQCVHGFPNALPCGGHWNDIGHRVAGESLSEFICIQLTNRQSTVKPVATTPPPAKTPAKKK